jgi:hypothetical protein
MTTETLIDVFTGIATIGIIISLLKSSDIDDDDGPDKGMMQPVYQGSR